MIEITNLTTVSVSEDFLKKVIQEVVVGEDLKKEVELSVVLAGPGTMRKLNHRFRKKNKVTDVLAFPESESFLKKLKTELFKKTKALGEIVICLRYVKKNSKRFSTTFEKELATVLIHGFLHLLGYEHENSKDKAIQMEAKQKEYLSKMQFS